MCPAECRVLAYVEPGLPILHTSRGIGLPGGIVMAMDCGIEVMSPLSSSLAAVARDFVALGGLLNILLACDSVSDEVSGGMGIDCRVFFCFRDSLLFGVARRLIASLLRYSITEVFLSSATARLRAVGLSTCARVNVFDMAWRRSERGE